MSQNSSNYGNAENENYGETYKQGKESTSSTPNVFSQNLGQTGTNLSQYEYNNYNNQNEEDNQENDNQNEEDNQENERRDYIREVVNKEEEDYPENNVNVSVSRKDLEIFEDKNNHIEELYENN